MLLRLPTSLSEARRCLADGAVPVGGATLVWAQWQRDGFPDQAMSLRRLPEATVVDAETLGAAVLLHQIDDRVPEVLRRAAASIGTGAVRRTATVGGNIVGSTLRCLLPPALVLDARATVMDGDGTYEAELAEVVAKRPLMLDIRWRRPLVSAYWKAPGEVGGPPPLVVATAVHTEEDGGRRLLTAVRDGDEAVIASVPATADAGRVLDDLEGTALGGLPGEAWDAIRREVTDILRRA
ncbi:FAD binding domain-containing protein [Streptomyces cellulosae]|uniref:FAD binding domain-containing protein n=1 Tax=Streptomyces TaxID=1883 RepID=UPI00048EF097|nr:FAD binding domain-containing protein [Streptomyces cellulosae]WSB51671.1 FAD binding domain-containing protein [Streptomyces cellulosae]WTB85708.1 FAD binding domain-containing protein [Streptomyces cellulosae]WTC59948.1 FAD binding domain-containing protein [Streptomyces cellulosae]